MTADHFPMDENGRRDHFHSCEHDLLCYVTLHSCYRSHRIQVEIYIKFRTEIRCVRKCNALSKFCL